MRIVTKSILPESSIADFVQSFWMLENTSAEDFEATILPDGIIDFFLFKEPGKTMKIVLKGIETAPSSAIIKAGMKIFAIGFRLPAVEYVLQNPVAGFVNSGKRLGKQYWQFSEADLNNFERFCKKATEKIRDVLAAEVDERKRKLFQLIYSSGGSFAVSQLAEQVHWSPRQINRYFTRQFGIPLKAYCSILRFRASFGHIRQGKLFPEQGFFDQAHFIKEVKKLAGVLPKELRENKNDRFLQFGAVSAK